MKNLFYPFQTINIVADYLRQDGQWIHRAFQAPGANSPDMAARAVYALLVGNGCTPASIVQVMGDYSLEELRKLADGPAEGIEVKCLYFDYALAMRTDRKEVRHGLQ